MPVGSTEVEYNDSKVYWGGGSVPALHIGARRAGLSFSPLMPSMIIIARS